MLYDFCIKLGAELIDNGFGIICGGKGGIMEAVCKGAHNSPNYYFGLTVGIIPENNSDSANKYCDIVIPTGIGFARNLLVINSSQITIAIAGGAGTLSEIAFAWQLNKTIFCFVNFDGWSKELAGKNLDITRDIPLFEIHNIEELISKLNQIYGKE